MRKTKIICTLGPATESAEVLSQMVEAGANIFRLNMSHATHEWVLVIMNAVFLLALSTAWARGLDISCGCFGKEAHNIQTHFPQLFLRDAALLATAIILFIAEMRAPGRRN